MLPAIEVNGLSKRYRIASSATKVAYGSLRDDLMRVARRTARFGRGEKKEKFWALRDVDFKIQPGEVVGIIGRNGAGKSTLLKLLSRVTEPTTGTIHYRGRLGSLLEVGTGFHPELTGRENIYLSGAILGMTRAEIKSRFDEIVDFSGVETFLETPVKRYSSGMQVRLGFAVAAHLEPEILIVDEVLAVGDAEFQKKCLGKMHTVADSGRTLLFVSHKMSAISQLCTSGILFELGRCVHAGPIEQTIQQYKQLATEENTNVHRYAKHPVADRDSQITSVTLANQEGPIESGEIGTSESLIVYITVHVSTKASGRCMALLVMDASGDVVAHLDSRDGESSQALAATPGSHAYRVEIAGPFLVAGQYSINTRLMQAGRGMLDQLETPLSFTIVEDKSLIRSRRGSVLRFETWQEIPMPQVDFQTKEGAYQC